MVLKNDAPAKDFISWSYLYSPMVEVTDISCLAFYTKLMKGTEFQVQLVKSENRTIFRTAGTTLGLNKVSTLKLRIMG